MKQAMKSKLFLSLGMITLILTFQNCAQHGFSTDAAGLNEKLGGSADSSTIDGAVSGDVAVKSPADLACGDVGQHINWELTDAQISGSAVPVPEGYKFVFKIHKNELPKTKVCTGDCGRAYKLNLHSFSGPIDLEYACRFDESRGIFSNTIYSTFDAIEAATHGGTDEFHELDRLFASKLRGEFLAEVSADQKELRLDFGAGNVLIFAAH